MKSPDSFEFKHRKLANEIERVPGYEQLAAKLRDCYHAWGDGAGTNFCRLSLCPQCNRDRSQQESNKLITRLEKSVQDTDLRTYHLTATMADAETSSIRSTIDSLKAAWKVFQRKAVKLFKNVEGTFRAIEIAACVPHHWLSNVHAHAALVVRPGYSGRNYIGSTELQEMWEVSAPTTRSVELHKRSDAHRLARYVCKYSREHVKEQYEEALKDVTGFLAKQEQLKYLKKWEYTGIL